MDLTTFKGMRAVLSALRWCSPSWRVVEFLLIYLNVYSLGMVMWKNFLVIEVPVFLRKTGTSIGVQALAWHKHKLKFVLLLSQNDL